MYFFENSESYIAIIPSTFQGKIFFILLDDCLSAKQSHVTCDGSILDTNHVAGWFTAASWLCLGHEKLYIYTLMLFGDRESAIMKW